MLGSATVTINPTPALFNVSGGGQRCFGSLGLPIDLSGSENNIRYVLYFNSDSIDGLDGTGNPLKFKLQLNSGNYTIKAVNKTNAVSLMMNGSASIAWFRLGIFVPVILFISTVPNWGSTIR